MQRQRRTKPENSKSKNISNKSNAPSNNTNDEMMQNFMDDPANMSPDTAQYLQRTFGNQFVNRMVKGKQSPTTIQRSPKGEDEVPGTQLWTVEEFQDHTAEYWMGNSLLQAVGVRDQKLWDIEIKLSVYHDYVDGNAFSQVALVKDMLDLTQSWLKENEDDKGSTLYKVMKRFGALLIKRRAELREPVRTKNPMASSVLGDWLDQDENVQDYTSIRVEDEPSPDGMFAKVAPMLDALVPSVGKGKIDIDWVCPVASLWGVANFKLGMHVVLEGERSPDGDMKVTSEVTGVAVLNANIGLVEAELRGELGGFIEAQGDNSREALNLISYAFYRRFSESSSSKVQDLGTYMWSGGLTGDLGETLADEWKSDVENATFGRGDDDAKGDGSGGNNYVLSGWVGSASLGGKSKAAGVEAKGGYKRKSGTRYDHDSPQGKGQTIHEASAEGTFGDHVSGKIAYQWLYDDGVDTMAGDKLSFEGSANVPLSKLNDSSGWLVGSMIIPTYASIFERGADMAKNNSAGGITGGIGGMGLDMTAKTAMITAASGAQFPRLVPDSVKVGEDGMDGSMKVKVGVEIENLFTPNKATVVSFTIANEGELSTGDLNPVLKITLEQSKLLLKFVYDNASGDLKIEYPTNGVMVDFKDE